MWRNISKDNDILEFSVENTKGNLNYSTVVDKISVKFYKNPDRIVIYDLKYAGRLRLNKNNFFQEKDECLYYTLNNFDDLDNLLGILDEKFTLFNHFQAKEIFDFFDYLH